MKWLSFFKFKPKLAVIRLAGPIVADKVGGMQVNFQNTEPLIDRAFKLSNLRGVALEINSPGGSPVQCQLIRDHIIRLQRKHKIPVSTFVEDMAVSGGYFLACAGENIYVSPSSIVGSIGVVHATVGLHRLAEKWGVEPRITTAGTRKVLANPLSPDNEENKARLTRIMTAIHQHFIQVVTEARANRLTKEIKSEHIFDGEIWAGEEAKSLGLVDGFKTVAEWAEDLALTSGYESLQIVRLKPKNALNIRSLVRSVAGFQLSSLLETQAEMNSLYHANVDLSRRLQDSNFIL